MCFFLYLPHFFFLGLIVVVVVVVIVFFSSAHSFCSFYLVRIPILLRVFAAYCDTNFGENVVETPIESFLYGVCFFLLFIKRSNSKRERKSKRIIVLYFIPSFCVFRFEEIFLKVLFRNSKQLRWNTMKNVSAVVTKQLKRVWEKNVRFRHTTISLFTRYMVSIANKNDVLNLFITPILLGLIRNKKKTTVCVLYATINV